MRLAIHLCGSQSPAHLPPTTNIYINGIYLPCGRDCKNDQRSAEAFIYLTQTNFTIASFFFHVVRIAAGIALTCNIRWI